MRELPDGWASAELAEVISDGPTNGYSPQSTNDAAGTLSLRLSATTTGRMILTENTTKRLAEAVPAESKFWLEPGDLLVQRANSLEYVGTAALYDGPPKTYIYPDLMMRLRVHEQLVNPRYLWRFINSEGARSHLRDRATGTAGNMPKINGTTLRELPVMVPPIREQRRLVDKIEDLTSRSNTAKQALDEVPALLEDFRRSVLAAAFRGDLTADWREQNPDVQPASELLMEIRLQRRLRWEAAEMAKMLGKGKRPADGKWKAKYEEPAAVDEEGLPELPEGWCWVRFDDVCIGSLYGPRFAADDYVSAPEGVPTLRTTDMDSRGSLRLKDPPRVRVSAEQLQDLGCEDGDLLVTRTGSIGKCAVYDESVGPALASAYLIRFRLLRSMVRPRYLLAALLSPRVQELLGLGATAVTQPNINARTIGAIPIAICGMQEQAEILRILESRWALRDVVETGAMESLADLADLDRAILAKAFRGELVPQDPTDEPAAALLDRLRADRAQTPPARRRR